MIKLRKEIARKERCKVILEKVAKQAQTLSKKYLKLIHQKDFDEVSRRFSVLTEPFIALCMKMMNSIHNELKIQICSATLLQHLISIMHRLVVIIPEIGLTKCILVRERVAGFISDTITQIKDYRKKCIRDDRIREHRRSQKGTKAKNVTLTDNVEIINDYDQLNDEFMKDLKRVPEKDAEKTVGKQNFTEFVF